MLRRTASGFTLVELMVVVVIITLLATIGTVSYIGMQQRARISNVTSSLKQAADQVSVYEVKHRMYPATLAAAEVVISPEVTYSYSQTSSDFCISATYKGLDAHHITSDLKVLEGACSL